MTVFAVLASAALLTFEGRWLCRAILRERGALPWIVGLPVGALLNAMLFAAVDIVGLPLKAVVIVPMHILLLIMILVVARVIRPSSHPTIQPSNHPTIQPWLRWLCIGLIILTLLPACTAALLLPSTGWDVFTNWAERSQLSLHAGHFLTSGVVQPQYPVLIHSLQMLPNVLLHDFPVPIYRYIDIWEWNDRAGNAMTLLLCLTTLASIVWMTRRARGRDAAILVTTLLLGIPLVMVHLRQGYADLPLSLFALLSAAMVDLHVLSRNRRMLLLSAMLCAAAAWTKIEGLYVVMLPWMAVLLWQLPQPTLILPLSTTGEGGASQMTSEGKGVRAWTYLITVIPVAMYAPWMLRTLLLGLPLSPHGFHPAWHGEAVIPMLRHLFLLGTFGPFFWLLPISLGLLLWLQPTALHPHRNPVLWMGLLSLMIVIAAYLGTDDVVGLLEGDNFSRAMVLPVPLLLCGIMLGWTEARRPIE